MRPEPVQKGSLSVVIPALEAATTVASAVSSAPDGAEVIVVDGGSRDRTAADAEAAGARVVRCPPGRARQLNRGARESGGDVLLFLHADCRLPRDAAAQVARVLASPGVVGGWFPQRISGGRALLRAGARGANLRARLLALPYGDQAIFVRREVFEAVGGFPDVPIMEDAGVARRVRRLGALRPASSPVTTGVGHWERLGPVLTGALDLFTLLLWLCGVPPRRLASAYHRLRSDPQPGRARQR